MGILHARWCRFAIVTRRVSGLSVKEADHVFCARIDERIRRELVGRVVVWRAGDWCRRG